jgi:hypothetical protein
VWSCGLSLGWTELFHSESATQVTLLLLQIFENMSWASVPHTFPTQLLASKPISSVAILWLHTAFTSFHLHHSGAQIHSVRRHVPFMAIRAQSSRQG